MVGHATREELKAAVTALQEQLDELTEALATLTRDHNGAVVATAQAVEATPTHADLRQLASAVGSLATRVAELESASHDRENVTLRAALKVAAHVAQAERDARDAEEALITRTQERDAARAAYERLRVTVMRVRRGDLVRCTTCEGYAAINGVMCPDCTDDAGEPRHGEAGLVLATGGAR